MRVNMLVRFTPFAGRRKHSSSALTTGNPISLESHSFLIDILDLERSGPWHRTVLKEWLIHLPF